MDSFYIKAHQPFLLVSKMVISSYTYYSFLLVTGYTFFVFLKTQVLHCRLDMPIYLFHVTVVILLFLLAVSCSQLGLNSLGSKPSFRMLTFSDFLKYGILYSSHTVLVIN